MNRVGNQIGTDSLVLLADLNEPAVGVSIVICCAISVLIFCWPENSWQRFRVWLDGFAARVGRAMLEVCDEPVAEPEEDKLVEVPMWVHDAEDGFHQVRVFFKDGRGWRSEVWNGEKLEFVVWRSICSAEELQQWLDVWCLGQMEGRRQVAEYLQQEFTGAPI